MEPKQLNIVLRDYQAKETHLEINHGRKECLTYQRSDSIDDYIEHRLVLEPVKGFLGMRGGITIGIGDLNISIAGSGPFFKEIERFLGDKSHLGRIYYDGRRNHWFYLHEVEPPKGDSSGLVAYLDDGSNLMEGVPIPLDVGESFKKRIDFRLQLKKHGEMTTTNLATIEVV